MHNGTKNRSVHRADVTGFADATISAKSAGAIVRLVLGAPYADRTLYGTPKGHQHILRRAERFHRENPMVMPLHGVPVALRDTIDQSPTTHPKVGQFALV